MELLNKEIENGYKECSVCKQAHNKGITILSLSICEKCNDKIINLNVKDEQYDYYKEIIKCNITDKIKFYKIDK